MASLLVGFNLEKDETFWASEDEQWLGLGTVPEREADLAPDFTLDECRKTMLRQTASLGLVLAYDPADVEEE